MTDIRESQITTVIPAIADADIRLSQVAPYAITQGGIAPAARVSQVAIVSISFEPEIAQAIRMSAGAIIAPTLDDAATTAIDMSQIAVIVISQELPWVPIIPPITLPNYLFSAIPFYVKR